MRRPPTERGLRKQELGRKGEQAAAAWYLNRGFAVLDRNWRCREGELDLVLARGDELVFCEVKTRTSTRFGTPLEAVTAAKQRRLRTLGLRWLAAHHRGQHWRFRFDVAAVSGDEVLVVENAF